MGMAVLLVGLVTGGVSTLLCANGWEIERLWLYLLGSAMFILVGVQLMTFWLLMRVLEELSQREEFIKKDMGEMAMNRVGNGHTDIPRQVELAGTAERSG
jgi:hypothetical protein